jgi:hypothetical protein
MRDWNPPDSYLPLKEVSMPGTMVTDLITEYIHKFSRKHGLPYWRGNEMCGKRSEKWGATKKACVDCESYPMCDLFLGLLVQANATANLCDVLKAEKSKNAELADLCHEQYKLIKERIPDAKPENPVP